MTEQTDKKIVLDESPGMPLQYAWRKVGVIYPSEQAQERIMVGRKFGAFPVGMQPQEAWLNDLIAMGDTLPRGKFFDKFRRRDRSEQYDLANDYLRTISPK